ncbi:MAG TPA: hypothetical protein VKQ27_08410, partial [Acetobacteraceae bacterium]|nr:hypothetical protein [Acetobacteraceae bacterium]
FGEPTEVLELVDLPKPSQPAAGEVLVGVEYAPINMNDFYLMQGAFPIRPSLPRIVGNVRLTQHALTSAMTFARHRRARRQDAASRCLLRSTAR